MIRPALKLRRRRQKHQSLLLAGILTFCILSCAGPALHGSFGVTPVGVSQLVSSQVQLHHPASSPVSPSAMMQSTSLATAEIASSSVIVYRPPAVHMVFTSTDSVKRATLPATIGVSATTMAVWQPHSDTAVDFDAPKAFITACIPASTGPGAQHLPASKHASAAMVLVFPRTVQVVSGHTFIMARDPALNVPSFHTYLNIATCADATKSLHCDGTRSSILVLVVFATHSIQTSAVTTLAPMLPATSSAPSLLDICYMESGLHDSVLRNFTQSAATAVTTPQACGTRQAALFAAHAVNTSTVILSMAQPTALPPGAFNMLGGRAPSLTTANIRPAAPSMIRFMTQPPALLPGSYITPGGRAPSPTSAIIRVISPTAIMLHTKAQLPALLPGPDIKPGGKATSNTNTSLPYPRLVPTMTHAMALSSSAYSKLDGGAISSEGVGTHLPHQNVTSGEWL